MPDDFSLQMASIRNERQRRYDAAVLVRNSVICDDFFNWESLELFPNWCYWPLAERNRLLMVSGALFCAPAIRLWIDARKIREVRSLIGTKTLSLVMANDAIPQTPSKLPSYENVEALLLGTGAAVLLNSSPLELHNFLDTMLPDSAGKLPIDIAHLLLSQAMEILHAINQELLDSDSEKSILKESIGEVAL